MPASGKEISHDAQQVLEQAFMTGPIHDRDILSIAGRNELHELGALERSMGYNTLNAQGILIAVNRRVHFKKRRMMDAIVQRMEIGLLEDAMAPR